MGCHNTYLSAASITPSPSQPSSNLVKHPFEILKTIATSGFQTALECTKFVFCRAPPRTLLGELTALPRPLSWFKGTQREKKVKRRDRGADEGKEEKGKG